MVYVHEGVLEEVLGLTRKDESINYERSYLAINELIVV